MSFIDPQATTYGASALSLPKVSSGDNTSTYRLESGSTVYVISASHLYNKRTRRSIRFNVTKLTADPFIPTNNVEVSMQVSVNFDLPRAGFTITEQLDALKALVGTLSATSYAEATKLLGGES